MTTAQILRAALQEYAEFRYSGWSIGQKEEWRQASNDLELMLTQWTGYLPGQGDDNSTEREDG